MMTEEQKVDLSRDRYGFWLGKGPGGVFYVFAPAGTDPVDGAALTYARAATTYETECWLCDRLDRLASCVAVTLPRQHAPSATARKKPRGVWGRLLDALWVGKHRNN